MKDLPLNALRALAAVYETGGIRPAGRRLGITHSSISRHLGELELMLGAPLFLKMPGTNTLTFSPHGDTLGKAALACLGALEKAVSSVREARQGNSVVISTTPSFAIRWLLPRLPDFEAANPSIEVSLLVDQRARSPGEDDADLSIRTGRKPRDEEFCEPLMDDRLFPVASPGYLQEIGHPKTKTAIKAARLLHDRDPQTHWDIWKRAHGPANLNVRTGSRFSSSDLVLKAAEQGMGLALAPGRLADGSIKSGALVPLFPGEVVEVKNAYWLILTPTSKARHVVRQLVAWLKAQAAEE
ncbi:MAG: LysR family transcriptional regulator [Alphaproteobacteria bacterium]|nr:LysR family transcriptional regulator [Alphaproteobacteria bacterium]